jgi:mannose-1-phosphate guanylyltransferase/phosphomannomutase
MPQPHGLFFVYLGSINQRIILFFSKRSRRVLSQRQGVVVIRAVIMAGGEGTRLRPLTCDIPKPMVPILNKPVMEYTIELLKKHNIKDISVTLAYLPSAVTEYFEDGKEWGVNLNYFIEETPLGTGGSVKNAGECLDGTFVVISGDALTDLDLERAVDFHRSKGAKATLVLKRESIPLEYGVIITDDNGRIIRFLEKPSWGEVFSDTINTGIYILEPEVLGYYKQGENFDFSKDLFPKLLRDGVPMYGYITGDYWCDIGDLESYKQTQFDILEGRVRVNISARQPEKGVWMEEGVEIGGNTVISPPVYLGRNCSIGEGCNIHPFTILGENCVIGPNSTVKKSILWRNVRAGSGCHFRGAVVCTGAYIKNGVSLFENSVIGRDARIDSNVTVKPGIKIWPDKRIDEGMTVTQNLIWGTKGTKTLFGYRDIKGAVNTDITPEFASRLGSAFATLMRDDAAIVVSCDGTGRAKLVRDSIVCGILSTGVGVIDIKNAPTPANRFAVTYFKADGGAHIRGDLSDQNLVHIELVGDNGANISRSVERKIENLFNRDDFERCNADRISEPVMVENFTPMYIKSGAALFGNLHDIKIKSPRILVSSRSGTILELAERFLKHIGCSVTADFSGGSHPSAVGYRDFLSRQVQKGRFQMGIIFGESGENLILIDDRGRVTDSEKYTALVSLIVLKAGFGGSLVLPYTASITIEAMAKDYGVKVIRTKSNPSNWMNEILKAGGQGDGARLQYALNFDAVWGAGGIVSFLVDKGMRLSELVDELPEFHYIKREIECSWQDKGRVIKEIVSRNKGKNIELFEGVKIRDDKGWALVLPDSERPVFNIYAEGPSEEYAAELSAALSDKVKELLEKN